MQKDELKEKIFLSRCDERIIRNLTERDIDFIEYVWNTFCIYFESKNRKALFFYRLKSEKKEPYGTLAINKDSVYITKYTEEKNGHFGTLAYSYNDFINSKSADTLENESREKILSDIETLQYNFYNKKKLKRTNIILTNEGTGKSKIVLDLIKPGEIYTAPDKEILEEKETYLKSLKKDFVRFYSNADIIYTTIHANRRNEKAAERIATKYLEQCKTLDRNFDKNELSEELNSISQKNTDYILKELKQITNEGIEIEKENSSISLIKFLKDNEDIYPDEKEIILKYYNSLIATMIKGTKIITCTTHKLKILLQKMKYKRKFLVYTDEIIDDIHGNIEILNKNKIDKKTYNFISRATGLKEKADTETPGTILKKAEKLKKKRNVENWYTLTSYNRFTSLVEFKNKDWMFNNKVCYIILTTEEKSKIVFPDAKIFDHRHKIYDDNINFICIDQFNSSIDENKVFRGHERPLIVKSCAETILDIKPEFYIGNSIGHSLKNNLHNIHNVRGTNTILNKLKKENGKKRIGISVTSPHPEAINLHKALFYNSNEKLKKKKLRSIDFEMEKYQDKMIEIIINDQLNQTIGRCNGYRKVNNTKTYVFITSQLLSKLKSCYVTKNVFRLSNFLNQKHFRETQPDIFKFLTVTNLLLNLKTDENRNYKEQPPKIKKILNLIIRKIPDRYANNIDNIENFFNPTLKKIFSNCIRFIQFLKNSFNKIKYNFSIIRRLILENGMKLILPHMYTNPLNDKKLSHIIVKSKTESLSSHFCDIYDKNLLLFKDFLLYFIFHNRKILI